MKNKIASIALALLLAGPTLANTEVSKAATTTKSLLSTNPVVTPAPLFQNSRFQHTGLNAALKGETIKFGAKGDSIKRVQNALIDMGFGLPAGADGHFGGQTLSALKAFQSSRGIAMTGEIDKKTLISLDKVSPAKGKKLWQDAKSAKLGAAAVPKAGEKNARVLVDLSEHRLTIYNDDGGVERVLPVAAGAWGTATDVGTKIVYDKVADPSPIAWALWPESRGGAFGTRMLDLSWYDPDTGASWGSGEELHGTYARNSIGTDASHGCVRMQNEDIEWVYNKLSIGDIVVIQK